MNDQLHKKSEEKSSFFLQLVNKHLPSDDFEEEEQPLGILEFILWMVGITAGFFILRYAFFLLF